LVAERANAVPVVRRRTIGSAKRSFAWRSLRIGRPASISSCIPRPSVPTAGTATERLTKPGTKPIGSTTPQIPPTKCPEFTKA